MKMMLLIKIMLKGMYIALSFLEKICDIVMLYIRYLIFKLKQHSEVFQKKKYVYYDYNGILFH